MPTTGSISHGPYLIKPLKVRDSWRARAFRGDDIASSIQSAASRDQAISAVKAELDAAGRAERASRSSDGCPSAGTIARGLTKIWPHVTLAQKRMLAAHFDAPGYVLTATQLSAAASYAGYGSANLHYGKLGRKLAEELNWEPCDPSSGDAMWTYALATDADAAACLIPDSQRQSGEFHWKLRPQVVEALVATGLIR